MMRVWFLLFLLCASPAVAADTAKPSFDALAAAVRADDGARARTYLTADSLAIYDRFVSYRLLACVPKDAAFKSEETKGGYRLLRGTLTDLSGRPRVAKLLFSRENGTWKLNLPATLQNGLGKKWKNQVHLSEQIFLIMRQRMGNAFDCNAIKELAEAK